MKFDGNPKNSCDAPTQTILCCRSVSRYAWFGDERVDILENVNLSIEAGQSVAICGTSGSGKTTLLGIMGGMDLPSEGEVWLSGVELTKLTEDDRAGLRADKVGFVFQSFQLIPSLTARENVMLPLELKGNRQANELAENYLARVGLSHRMNHFPSSLSGGEQQRVAIARAFACHPEILFADEPTGNLDARTGHAISDLLFELNRENGTTLVLVTHDERLARRCDRVFLLEEGELREQSS